MTKDPHYCVIKVGAKTRAVVTNSNYLKKGNCIMNKVFQVLIIACLSTLSLMSVGHATPLVQKGDQIIFSADTFAQASAMKTVEWSQNFKKRRQSIFR